MGNADLRMADIGEKEFLCRLLPMLKPHPSFVNGFGDDASAIAITDKRLAIFKVDRAATPMAAKRGWVDYRMWGRLAVTSNCSDILAAGGKPAAVMIAMILPGDWSVQHAIEIVEGCAEECAANDVVYAGGDTKEGRSAEVVGSAFGFCKPDRLLTRHGAQPGDLIVVAGELGGFLGSYLQLVRAEQEQPPSADRARWLDYVAKPRARWAEAAVVREAGIATAGMDISDGLYDAVSVLTKDHGAEIWLNALPYHGEALTASRALGIEPLNLALGVGDWGIVYAVNEERWPDFDARLPDQSLKLTVIGQVTESRDLRWSDGAGNFFRCKPVVNEHFVARQEDEEALLARLRTDQVLIPV